MVKTSRQKTMKRQSFKFPSWELPLIFLFVWSFFTFQGCSKAGRRIGKTKAQIIQRLQNDCELTLGNSARLDHFLEKNPEYNPSWIAKITVTNEDAFNLRNNLNKKTPYRLKRKGSLSDGVVWWQTAPSSEKFEYMTSSNAPVIVFLSETTDNFEVLLYWSSP